MLFLPNILISTSILSPLINRSEIEFTNCDILPPEVDNPNSIIVEKLLSFINKNENVGEEQNKEINNSPNEKQNIFIKLEEIKNKSRERSKTTTFKNFSKKNKSHKYTSKNRNIFIEDEDVDEVQSQEDSAK